MVGAAGAEAGDRPTGKKEEDHVELFSGLSIRNRLVAAHTFKQKMEGW
jgi:hypothetical protein